MALRERLAALNPARTVTINGITKPAIIVAENEVVVPVEPLPDAFYIEWGPAALVEGQGGLRRLMEMDCVISHHTLGSTESGVDRGRQLTALDTELLSICQPSNTAKQDFSQSPSLDLETRIVWSGPEFGELSGVITQERSTQRIRLERKAKLKVFFFPEVNFQ